MKTDYRLLTFRSPQGRVEAGVLVAGEVHPVSVVLQQDLSVLEILQQWATYEPMLARSEEHLGRAQGYSLSEVGLLAPIQYPAALFCAGANYHDHTREMMEANRRRTGQDLPMPAISHPWFFVKTAAHSIVGPGEPIRLPPGAEKVDWEAELAVVIGRDAYQVAPASAMDHVAGFTIINDVSARDLLHRADRAGTAMAADWFGHKCFAGSAPMGPWITPKHRVPDYRSIEIRLWVNDELKQDSTAAQMVHSIEDQIAYLSRFVALRPGDVIATGTPAGVGVARGQFLRGGDVVRIELSGLGSLTNPVLGATA